MSAKTPMSPNSTIDCPDCGAEIAVSAQLLITGEKLHCSNPKCDVSISLNNSSVESLKDAMAQFEKLKNK